MMNFNLTEDEFEAISDKYKTHERYPMFNYADFCALINLAFTVKGIDKSPQTIVLPVTSDHTHLARRKYLETTEDERN